MTEINFMEYKTILKELSIYHCLRYIFITLFIGQLKEVIESMYYNVIFID